MTKPKSRRTPRILLPRRNNTLIPTPGLQLLARAKTWTWPHWPCVVTAVQASETPTTRLAVRFYPDASTAEIDPADCLDFTQEEVQRVLEYARSKPRTKKDVPALLHAVQVAQADVIESNQAQKMIQAEVEDMKQDGDEEMVVQPQLLQENTNKRPRNRMCEDEDEADMKRGKGIEEEEKGELSDCTESVSTVVTYSHRGGGRLELVEKAPNLPVRKRWLVKTPVRNKPMDQTEVNGEQEEEKNEVGKLCEVDTNIMRGNCAE